MAAIASLSDLVNRLTGGSSGTPESIWFHKQARVAGASAPALLAGRPTSLWRYDGSPSAGVAPTTVANPDNTTAGGLKQADPGGGRQKWMTSAWLTGLNPGTLVLYDRLLHIGGLSGTNTGAQTVGGSLTRYTNGLGNFVFVEIYTAIGATPTTVTMSYTDQGGASGNTSPAVVIGGTNHQGAERAILLPLAAGDTGVQAVASVTVLASTGTAGNFGVVVGHPLAVFDINNSGLGGGRSFAQGLPGLPEILTDACLAWLWIPQSTAAPEITGGVAFVEA